MHVYIYETNILVDFVLNKKMREEEKKTTTPEKHPGRVAQGHKLAALMKKSKKEKLRNIEQSSTVYRRAFSTVKWDLRPWRRYACNLYHQCLCIFCI